MDLATRDALFSQNFVITENTIFSDTTLSLSCFSPRGSNVDSPRSSQTYIGRKRHNSSDDACKLVLGLGPTPSRSKSVIIDKKRSSYLSESDSILKLGLVPTQSHTTEIIADNDQGETSIQVIDEGSTSAKKSGGYMPSLLSDPQVNAGSKFWSEILEISPQPSFTTNISGRSLSERAITETSSDHRGNTTEICSFNKCAKGAHEAIGGLCIECLGRTKTGGGRTEYGGKRCRHPSGCQKAARGKSGLCIRHGGGKRCKIDSCTRSAEGQAGLCISHGGGRRCQYHGCLTGAQGSTMYCKAHGGGKRCVFTGCLKGAEGSTPLCKGHGGGKRCLFDGGGICPKSVHGGTDFCVAHGGGKRCVVPDCTKSARGRTDCCVKHGGGKRCQIENCGKSAQGSTDFCKAHGGGKRCNWLTEKCEKFARGKSGLCASHSSMSLSKDRENKKEGLIGPGLFHGLVLCTGSSITGCCSQISVISDCCINKRQQLIPPLVLVPQSMQSSPSVALSWDSPSSDQSLFSFSDGLRNASYSGNGDGRNGNDVFIPEGRVHNGNLMSRLSSRKLDLAADP